MTGIVAFLEARITEDERMAKHGHREREESHRIAGRPDQVEVAYATRRGFTGWVDQAPPIPPRVLAECEAKRNLVQLIDGVDAAEFHRPDEPAPTSQPYMRHDVAQGLLRVMAQPYADHPDFSPEWRA